MEENKALDTSLENNLTESESNDIPKTQEQKNELNKGHVFSISESIYAWLCLIFGYAFCKVVPMYLNPLAAFLLICTLFAVTLVVTRLNSGKLTVNAIVSASSAILVNLSLVLCANKTIHTVSVLYGILAFTYFVYSAFENNIDGKFSNFMIADIFKSAVVMPFSSFGKMFTGMFASKNKSVSKTFLKIILGLIVAVIPTVIVVSLLSFDSDFTKLLNSVFSVKLFSSSDWFTSLLFGIPVGMYLYGIFISSADKKCDYISKESCERSAVSMKISPCITACTAVMPIFFVYILYFVSQFKYFCSAFTDVLPENYSYAEYARSGFFQLLAVTVINALIILALILFSKQNSNFEKIILKIVTILFSLATLILICSALSKMLMYINYYGLTPKRVYTSWFMVTLSLIVVAVIVKQIVGKLKLIPIATIICVVMVAVLSLGRVDSFIAKYNVDKYINNELPSVDIALLDNLSEDSIEHMVRLKKHLESKNDFNDTQLIIDLNNKLSNKASFYNLDNTNIFTMSLPRYRAKKALKSAGYME